MVSENRALRMMFCPRWKEQDSGKKVCEEELGSSFSLPDVTRGFKSRALKCVRHVASMEKTKMHTEFERKNLIFGDLA
jgi:hypothetical protein